MLFTFNSYRYVMASTNARSAPHVSILATCAWTVVLIASLSSFATLINYLSSVMWLYYGLVGVAVIVTRRSARRGGGPSGLGRGAGAGSGGRGAGISGSEVSEESCSTHTRAPGGGGGGCYNVPGYPMVPVLYAASCVYLSGCTFVAAPVPCAAAMGFIAVSFPVYWAMFVWTPRLRNALTG